MRINDEPRIKGGERAKTTGKQKNLHLWDSKPSTRERAPHEQKNKLIPVLDKENTPPNHNRETQTKI